MTQIRSNPAIGLARARRNLPMSLLRAREHVMERFRPMLHRHDVTEQQWRVLRILYESDGMDATDLAAGACVLAPSLSRIIRTLESRNMIEVGKDPKDRRRATIHLSLKGEEFIKEVAPESAAIYREIEARVGVDRIETLLDEIDKLMAALTAPETPV
ncbi:homoprotocatechuate degradation operon regulator HpaR [Paracoccus albus]|uniref:homoprotocatechuate degradation operon regulator HpaR n=1 Tax=Paracoccus albus TaxID=3017784 RepID=UPI0022F1037E|nr:homoprotocatechuate degradation operon regulator HpaR [Paracoccus albus]WBU59276.1 homoprotocatechuate degradation operon regulator HpaR [Paracoccus albus]